MGLIILIMATEYYDEMEWDVEEIPCSSSTPDIWFENSFRATTECENGHIIHGTANYWSDFEDMSYAWLNSIDYEPCEECDSIEEEDEEDDI